MPRFIRAVTRAPRARSENGCYVIYVPEELEALRRERVV